MGTMQIITPSSRTQAEEDALRDQVRKLEERGVTDGTLSKDNVNAARRNISDPGHRLRHYEIVFGLKEEGR